MSRYIADYTINKPDDLIKFIAEDFLTKEGFRQTVYKGETVWKKGVGAVSAPQFIKLQYGQGNVHLEAWIKSFGEHGVTGFYGALPKSELNSRVQTLVRLLSQEIPATQAPIPTGATAADSFAKESPTPAPVPVAVHNPDWRDSRHHCHFHRQGRQTEHRKRAGLGRFRHRYHRPRDRCCYLDSQFCAVLCSGDCLSGK